MNCLNCLNKPVVGALLLASPLLAGCEKYVDIRTKGTLVPNETTYFRYLLNNTGALERTISLADIAADDTELADLVQQNGVPNYFARTYTWQPFIYDASENDPDWNTPYSVIYYANTVIDQVLASDGSDADKQELRAEALVHRADAYLALVTEYAQAYDASTAGTDLGVPMLLTVSVDAKLPRLPVQAVYDQIIKDLTEAVDFLPATNSYKTLPSKAAAYALLARTHLFMRTYDLARQNAERALAIQSTLVDLKQYETATYPRRIADPEIILSKVANTQLAFAPSALRLSASLLSLLPANDLRYVIFTKPAASVSTTYTGRYTWRERLTGEPRNIGPSVPEMLLIKAEGQARQNDAAGAISTLNTLRIRRFRTADYVALQATNPAAALQAVLDERRRELFFRCLRWPDQKRLNKEPQFARTVTRPWLATNGIVPAGTYTLAPGGNRYALPIPPIPLRFNPDLVPNP